MTDDVLGKIEPRVQTNEFHDYPDLWIETYEARWMIDEIRRLRNVIVHKNAEIKRLRFWSSETIALHNRLYSHREPDDAVLFDDWMDRGPDGITLPHKQQ